MKLAILKWQKIKFLVFLHLILISCVEKDEYYFSNLDKISKLILDKKDSIYNILYESKNRILSYNFEESKTREELDRIRKLDELFVITSLVDSNSNILYTSPIKFKYVEGTYIGEQPHVRYIKKNRYDYVSLKFRSVQGEEVFSFISPILKDSIYLGTLNILVNPDKFYSSIIEQVKSNYKLVVIQNNGIISFSEDYRFKDKNVLSEDTNDILPHYRIFLKAFQSKKPGSEKVKHTKETIVTKAYWKKLKLGTNYMTLVYFLDID